MLDAKEQGELDQGIRLIRIVWAAMLLSLGVYLYVCHSVAGRLPVRDSGEFLPTLRTVLVAVVAVELIIIPRLRRIMLRPGARARRRELWRTGPQPRVATNPAVAQYMAATVVSLALAESIGIYGMVLFFLGSDLRELYLFVAVSAATMIHFRPKAEELQGLAAAMKPAP